MVYDTYNYSIHEVKKPAKITGGHIVCIYISLSICISQYFYIYISMATSCRFQKQNSRIVITHFCPWTKTKEEILNKLRGHEFRVDEAPARQTPAAYGYDPRLVGNPVGKRWEDLFVILTRKNLQFHREQL